MGGPKIHNIEGEKFHHLTAKKYLYSTKYGAVWECECDCGNITTAITARLRRHKKKTCGCSRHGKGHHMWSGYGDMIGCSWANIVSSAKERDIELAITKEDAWNLFVSQSELCALSGVKLKLAENTKDFLSGGQTASLDRIDSNIGYIKGNIQWIHKDLNKMKMNLEQDKFLEWCKLCYKHGQRKKTKVSTKTR